MFLATHLSKCQHNCACCGCTRFEFGWLSYVFLAVDAGPSAAATMP